MRVRRHEPAERLSSAREPRHHRADGYAERRRRFLVTHAFEPDEQDRLAVVVRQHAQRAFQIPDVQAFFLGRLRRQLVLHRIERHRHARGAAARDPVDVEVVENREQVGPYVAYLAPCPGSGDGAGEAFLHQVVRFLSIAFQGVRVTPQGGNMKGERGSGIRHGEVLLCGRDRLTSPQAINEQTPGSFPEDLEKPAENRRLLTFRTACARPEFGDVVDDGHLVVPSHHASAPLHRQNRQAMCAGVCPLRTFICRPDLRPANAYRSIQ